MKQLIPTICCFLMTLIGHLAAENDSLRIYDPPKAVLYSMHNDDFTVKVRKPGGEWQDLFEYKVQVDMDRVQEASMVYFDFSGNVEVMIRKNNGKVQSVDIRPLSYNVQPTLKGNIIFFTLQQARNLSVEINGDRLRNLHLFANEFEKSRPDPNDPNVVYFGPGVHEPPDKPGKVFQIRSGQTVYIHGSAIVKGKLLCDRVKDVRILGRGILLQAERGIELTYSENVEIDGITVVNPRHYTVYGGSSRGLTIRNLKSFSCRGWSDGIDLMSCSDVLIDGVFMRNSDDCIAIYGHRWGFYGNARNYRIQNATLWADIAHPTNIGLHGNAEAEGDTIENIIFSNIDILEHDEDDRNYQGCMSINASDNNLVRNLTYENIRIEDFQEGQLLNIRVYYNEKYSKAPGRGIENIRFKNISYKGFSANPSRIKGHNAERMVKGIVFENLMVNGKKVSNAEEAQIRIEGFVKDIRFK